MSTDDRWADYLDSAPDDPSLDPEVRAYLDRARRTLSEPTTWDGPPAGLEDRLLDLAATTPQDSADASDAVRWDQQTRRTSGSRRRASGRSGRLRLLTVAVAAAAAVVVFAIVVPQVVRQAPVEHYTMAGTSLAPRASATVDVESKSAGDAITLHITGLTAAPAGSYYAGWLTGPKGTVPVGTFHWRKGGIPIELWSGVDTQEYTDFVITLQREGQSPERSDQVVLRGSLHP
ncbi:MAG TPA: anti-sigma factor [Propionibacteriaceae bacterium]|nr:anti-sigma factor [Propionibacteriaceae bacterium]